MDFLTEDQLCIICVIRLESQMTADIQAILQLLQRQTAAGPPAYSTVTSSPEYHSPPVSVQPAPANQTHLSLDPAPPLPQVNQNGTVSNTLS